MSTRRDIHRTTTGCFRMHIHGDERNHTRKGEKLTVTSSSPGIGVMSVKDLRHYCIQKNSHFLSGYKSTRSSLLKIVSNKLQYPGAVKSANITHMKLFQLLTPIVAAVILIATVAISQSISEGRKSFAMLSPAPQYSCRTPQDLEREERMMRIDTSKAAKAFKAIKLAVIQNLKSASYTAK